MFRFSRVVVCLCLAVGCSSDSNIGTVPFELSDPNADVTITVDGKPIQITSLRQPFDFKVGVHQLRVEGDRYETIERTWQVMSGVNPVLKIDLVPTAQQAVVQDDTNTMLEDNLKREAQKQIADVAESNVDPKSVVEVDDLPVSEQNETPIKEDPIELTAREKEVSEWVVSVGGSLTEGEGMGIILPKESHFTEEDFDRFQDLPNLHTLVFHGYHGDLNVDGHDLNDDHLMRLSGLPKLRMIGAQGPGITDRSMEHLAGFPIEVLVINNSNVTGEGLSSFSRHVLTWLSLDNSPRVGDDGLLDLNLSKVGILALNRTGVSDRFMKSLVGNSDLKILNFSKTDVNGQGLSVLQESGDLRQLGASELSIHDEHLRFLQNHKNLSSLYIDNTKVTAAGVQFIASSFPNLKTLAVWMLNIPESRVVDWNRLQDLEVLHFWGNHIGNRQLQSFTVMKKLRDLRINTGPTYFTATRQGLLAFKKALPNCKINGMSVDELTRELFQ